MQFFFHDHDHDLVHLIALKDKNEIFSIILPWKAWWKKGKSIYTSGFIDIGLSILLSVSVPDENINSLIRVPYSCFNVDCGEFGNTTRQIFFFKEKRGCQS